MSWRQNPFVVDNGSPVNFQNPLNLGCVAWWLGLPGQAGGGLLFDILRIKDVRYNAHAILKSKTTVYPIWTPGVGGFPALKFDGTNAYAQLSTTGTQLSGLTQFTIEALVYLTNNPAAYMAIFSFSSTLGLFLHLSTTKMDFVSVSDHSGATTVTKNAWHHVCWVRNASGNLVGYLDGKQDFSAAVSVTLTGGTWGISSSGSGGVQPFPGLIQHVKVWNRALTADEIQRSMFLSLNGYGNLLNRIGSRQYLPVVASGVQKEEFAYIY